MIISDSLDTISVKKAADLLDVSRSGFYKWFQRSISVDNDQNSEIQIREELQNIVIEFPGYGYRRATIELQNRGHSVTEKMIRKFMREDNLLCVKKRFRLRTTDSNHGEKIYPNLARELRITDINQLWVADITYIQLSKEFVYLAVVIDVFSRRCIGWELNRHIDTDLTLNALRKAFRTRKGDDLKGLIHHSDQGVQYASKEYVDCLKVHGILVSMSRAGNPYDNAFAESFIKTLKCEEVYLNEYETFNDALANIDRFIEEVYVRQEIASQNAEMPLLPFEVTLLWHAFSAMEMYEAHKTMWRTLEVHFGQSAKVIML